MQDNTNTEVPPMRDIIERYYQSLRPRLATQAEREALDAFYERIRLVEDTDAVVQAYYAVEHAYDNQLATRAEYDAISDFCQGICSHGEDYYYDYDEDDYEPMPHELDHPAFYTEQYLPDEFFLAGTGYVVLPPLEEEPLTAVATAIRELNAEADGAEAPVYTTLEDLQGYAQSWAHHWAGKLDTADAETLKWVTHVPDLPLTEAQFACIVQYVVNTRPGLRNPHQAVYEALCQNSNAATYAALDAAEAYFGVRVTSGE